MPPWRRLSLISEQQPLAEQSLELHPNVGQLQAMHDAFSRFWLLVETALPQPPTTIWRVQFETAVAEVVANIIRHAYPPEPIHLSLLAYRDRIEARSSDRGRPYLERETPPEEKARRAEALGDLAGIPEGGFGLPLVRATVDSLDYSRTQSGWNEWELAKRFG